MPIKNIIPGQKVSKEKLQPRRDLQQEEDTRREQVLNDMGLRIIRFRNEEILKNLSMVVGKIKENLSG